MIDYLLAYGLWIVLVLVGLKILKDVINPR
jgi:hypothetical protein